MPKEFNGTKKKYILQSNEKWELKRALFSRKLSVAEILKAERKVLLLMNKALQPSRRIRMGIWLCQVKNWKERHRGRICQCVLTGSLTVKRSRSSWPEISHWRRYSWYTVAACLLKHGTLIMRKVSQVLKRPMYSSQPERCLVLLLGNFNTICLTSSQILSF